MSSPLVFGYRAAPRLADERRAAIRRTTVGRGRTRRPSLGLPAPAVTGVRFALEPGVGRNAVPVRSAILGAALAVIVVVATVTFSSQPQRAGVASPPVRLELGRDPCPRAGDRGTSPTSTPSSSSTATRYVLSWSGAYAYDLHIDGQVVPVLRRAARHRGATPAPVRARGSTAPVRSCWVPSPWPSCTSTSATPSPSGPERARPPALKIVGVDTMPTIGAGGGPHLEMGTGALLSSTLIPAAARDPFNDPTTGPEEIFVNFRPGVNRKAATASLNRIANAAVSNNFNFGVFTGPVLRPAEIINYRSMGTTPAILGSALAAGAVVALGLTLVASVRRRRRDLALLKTLGVHPTAAGVGRRLAVHRRRGHRDGGRRATRHRAGPGPVDLVRQRDPRRTRYPPSPR